MSERHRFLRASVCVCVFAHVHVAQSCHCEQREGDTRELNGTGALRGLQDNVGLTDPTKWAITSQWRDLGSRKDPKSCRCHSAGSVDTQTYVGRGHGGLKGSAKSGRGGMVGSFFFSSPLKH